MIIFLQYISKLLTLFGSWGKVETYTGKNQLTLCLYFYKFSKDTFFITKNPKNYINLVSTFIIGHRYKVNSFT